jgi:hypothetical protein
LVMIMYEQHYLNKDQSFVMLMPSIRLYHVFMFNSSRMIFELLIVSVRNVVPTLTSSKRQGLSLNGRC